MTILAIYDKRTEELVPVRIDEEGYLLRCISDGKKTSYFRDLVIPALISTEPFIKSKPATMNSKRKSLYNDAERIGREKYKADCVDVSNKIVEKIASPERFFRKPKVRLELMVSMYFQKDKA